MRQSYSANNLGSNGHLLSMQGTNYGRKVYRCDVRRRFRRVTSDMFVLVYASVSVFYRGSESCPVLYHNIT